MAQPGDRYHVDSGWRLDFDSFIIRTGMRAALIHNGCAVQVGPDHKLWIRMGEAGHPSWAQDPDRLNGKILRVNRDGSVPADNPIWPGHGQPTIVYSIGHRNPQGISFQPGTHRVYAAEHGPDRDDEINWIRAGRNYGWPCVTGNNHVTTGIVLGDLLGPAWSSEGPTWPPPAAFVNKPELGELEQEPVRVDAEAVGPASLQRQLRHLDDDEAQHALQQPGAGCGRGAGARRQLS